MKFMHAFSLGLALTVGYLPAASAQADPHEHAQATATPVEPAAKPASAAPAGKPPSDRPMSGMSCDPEMHEKMMKRMDRMEAMMEKMLAAKAGSAAAETKPANEAEQHQH